MQKTGIKALIIMMVLALAVALCACGGSDVPKDASSDEPANAPVEKTDDSSSNDENTSEDSDKDSSSYTKAKALKTSESGKIEVLESGYSYDKEDGYVTAGVVIGNASSKKAFEYAGVRMTAYGDDGSVIGTTEATHEYILPGENDAFSVPLDTKGKNPKRVEFKADQGDEADDTEGAISSKDVVVLNTSENIDEEYGEIQYTGEIENKSKKDISSPYITVLLRKKGKIVYAYEELLDDLPKGEKTPFDFSFSSKVKHDKYEFYVAK